ncbi:MAG TPA: GMC family oxidoreductase [Blastocatellia bacterium]|nr:GMC family oxidoreductase [Blastocatellia bacterium]
MGDTHFDVVIVGSGFGGSVMAYRLAEAGLRVCVLERGKAYPPGSFPRSPFKLKENFWDPSKGLHGMFNIWGFENMGAVVSSGLGGGSLIYANVLIRKPEEYFIKEDVNKGGWEYWPVTRAELDPHYDQVETMMNAQRYPLDHAPYSSTRKTLATKEAAAQLNLDWHLPKLAVTFANPNATPVPGVPIIGGENNLHGLPRSTCRLCGECDIGCNYGSKNTLDYTYLSAAKRAGADIRTRCEVRTFEPFTNGGARYRISYVDHAEGERRGVPSSKLEPVTITANRLVLAAGTFGSTYLLLKNRASFPGVSDKLGTRFSGNGDLLTLVFEAKNKQGQPRILDGSFGPVITSAIHGKDALEGGKGRGFYVEDAGYPDFVNWIMETSNQPGFIIRGLKLGWRILMGWLGLDKDADLGEEISKFLGPTTLSSTFLPLLTMGRDVPDGRMYLSKKGFLELDWKEYRSKPYVEDARATLKKIAAAIGGTYVPDPVEFLKKLITVHPLGGCPMGRNTSEGVVDSYGEVFNHPGLYVMDGAVMPGPVGPNPSLTIAAVSNRAAEHIIETR